MGSAWEMFSYQYWLRRLLMWLIDEKDLGVQQVVNDGEDEEEEEDNDNQHIINNELKVKRRKHRKEDLKIEGDSTKEEIIEKFQLLKEAFDELRDGMTRLEFEVEQLRDEKIETEEEMKLQRVELQKLIEFTKVLKQEREGHKHIIRRQQEIIKAMTKEEDVDIRDII